MNTTTLLKLKSLLEQFVNDDDVWEWLTSLRGNSPVIPEPLPDPVVPEPTPTPAPIEPEVEMYGFKYKRVFPKVGKISIDKILRDKFEIPGCGPDYGSRLLFVFDNNDHLPVPSSTRRVIGRDGRKYQPGGGYGTTPGMEVYLGIERYANNVTMYFNQMPNGIPAPPDPLISSDWVRINWGGNPNETSDDRDRTWWTKIHGSSTTKWSYKFPLPRSLDDKSRKVEFRFADGSSLYVPDSTSMAMNSNGPKYRPEDPGEGDSRKKHPKVGGIPGATPQWCEYRIV